MKIVKTVKVISKYCGEWVIDDNKGMSYYLVTVYTDVCKPRIEKCTREIYEKTEIGFSASEDSIAYDKNGKIAFFASNDVINK